MRIAINCRSFLNRQYTGIGRYAFNLVQSISRIDEKNKYLLYVPKGLFDQKKVIPRFDKKNFAVKVDWFKRGVNKIIKSADIYHSPSPDVIAPQNSKVVVTVHDLVYKAFPEAHTEQTLLLTDQQMRSFLPHVSKIICCSKSTQRDLLKYFPVDIEKTAVVYPGVDKNNFYPMSQQEKDEARAVLVSKGMDEPFILFVGTIEPRKNLKNLLCAFAKLKNEHAFKGNLVVVGMKGWKSEDFETVTEQMGIKNHVINLGFVSDHQLKVFYNLCEVFVFPSLYEGFGYPIIEAFCCGACVITSNVSSCPEVAGGGACKVNPRNPDEIASAMKKVIDDPKFKNDLRDEGYLRSREFSHERTARETLKIYQEVVTNRQLY